MRVVISPRAERQLRKISKTNQIAIARKIRSVRDGQKVSKEEKLKGHRNIFRVRVGQYRIVYKKTTRLLYIILIGHRRDIYRLVKQLLR